MQEQHFSLHFVNASLYLFRSLAVFGFVPYHIASSFFLNSFSYLIIPPPWLTIPRCSFCHYILSLLPSAISLSLHSICFLLCQLQIPHLFSVLPIEQILVLHWALSTSIPSALECAFLGAELMTTSPTSNRCCDTHSSPAMTLTFLYFVSHIVATASNQLHSLYHQIHRWPICSLSLEKKCL